MAYRPIFVWFGTQISGVAPAENGGALPSNEDFVTANKSGRFDQRKRHTLYGAPSSGQEPNYIYNWRGAQLGVASIVAGNPTTVNLSATHGRGATVTTFPIVLAGVTGALQLNRQWPATRVDTDTVTIPIDTTGETFGVGSATCDVQSLDIYYNPYASSAFAPNGATWIEQGGAYPSTIQGPEMGWFGEIAELYGAYIDVTGAPSEQKDFWATATPLTESAIIKASMGQAKVGGSDSSDGGVTGGFTAGIRTITNTGGKTQLQLTQPHGITVGQSRNFFVYGLPEGHTPKLMGFYAAEATAADAIEINVATTVIGQRTGQSLGSVARPFLEATAATISGDRLRITTSRAHGLTTSSVVYIGGWTGASPANPNNRHPVVATPTTTQIEIEWPTSTVGSFANAWIENAPNWHPAYSNGANGWDRMKDAIDNAFAFYKDTQPSNQPLVAGIVASLGWREINNGIVGTTYEAEVFRQPFTLNEILRELQDYCYAKETTANAANYEASARHIPTVYVPNYLDERPHPDQGTWPGRNRAGHFLLNLRALRSRAPLALAGLLKSRTLDLQSKMQLQDSTISAVLGSLTANFPDSCTSTFTKGREMFRAWWQAFRGVSTTVQNQGVPVFIIAGQSQTESTILNSAALIDDDPNYDGTNYDAAGNVVVQRDAYIWDIAEEEWQEYSSQRNTNTDPVYNAQTTQNVGPEASLILSLRERYPNGVYLIKFAKGATGLQSGAGASGNWQPGGQLYQRLQEIVREAMESLKVAGKQPVLRGFFWDQGEGDTADGFYQTYETALRGFFDRVRLDFGTYVAGQGDLEIVCVQLQDHDRQSFLRAGVDAIRAAQAAVAASDGKVALCNVDSCPIGDGIHRSYRGQIRAGLLMGEAYGTLSGVPARVDDFALVHGSYVGVDAIGTSITQGVVTP